MLILSDDFCYFPCWKWQKLLNFVRSLTVCNHHWLGENLGKSRLPFEVPQLPKHKDVYDWSPLEPRMPLNPICLNDSTKVTWCSLLLNVPFVPSNLFLGKKTWKVELRKKNKKIKKKNTIRQKMLSEKSKIIKTQETILHIYKALSISTTFLHL